MKIDITFDGNKKVSAHFNNFTVTTDQPVRAGGDETAPTPFDLFLVSMGTCAGIFVKGFCDQRGISTEGMKLTQSLKFNHETHLVEKINIDIFLPPDFPEKYKSAVINAANLCTVKRHFTNPPEIIVSTQSL